MKILSRTQFGNPILRKKAMRVSVADLKKRSFHKLVEQMFYTMKKANGVGLAAPQIGKPLQLAVLHVHATKFRPDLEEREKTVLINPKILRYGTTGEYDWEGCLSFPDVRGVVPRATKLDVEYTNLDGKKVRETINGFTARVFQHEIDHLHGIVYVDRMENMLSLSMLKEFQKYAR